MERYVLRGGRWGYERLQLLARVRRADTAELLRLAGLRPGLRCLDLGCGGGEVTFELARLAGPSGSVVGIDLDEVELALARKAAAGVPHPEVRLVQGFGATPDGKALTVSTLEAAADAIVTAGLATAEEVAAAIADLAAFAADPATVVSEPRVFQLWARR